MQIRWQILLITTAILIICGRTTIALPTIKIDGRPYVEFAEVASAEELGETTRVGTKQFQAGTGGRSLRVELDSREAVINDVRHWLGFPAQLAAGQVCVSEVDYTKTIRPALQPGSVDQIRPFKTVVLDAGHGGHDRGGSSKHGVEKEFALDLSRRVRSGLQRAGLRVVMTRDKDAFIPLESRPRVANALSSSIFVSLHFNSAEWRPSASGVEVYCLPPRGVPPAGQDRVLARDGKQEAGHATEPQNFILANAIQHSILAETKMDDRGVKRARFAVLRGAKVPAVLVEGGFMSNSEEAKKIASPDWREGLAQSIVTGILEFKKLADGSGLPRELRDY